MSKENDEQTVNPAEPDGKVAADMEEARKNLDDRLLICAAAIVEGLVNKAKKGEVAPAKYLFEAAGLYPARAEKKPEQSVVYQLYKRLKLPDPAAADETSNATAQTSPEQSEAAIGTQPDDPAGENTALQGAS
jgi:hypothetical protein